MTSIEADQIEKEAKLASQFMGLQVQKYAYNDFHVSKPRDHLCTPCRSESQL